MQSRRRSMNLGRRAAGPFFAFQTPTVITSLPHSEIALPFGMSRVRAFLTRLASATTYAHASVTVDSAPQINRLHLLDPVRTDRLMILANNSWYF
jgi:hypothetical protein